MILATELIYQLDYLKKELEKKENSEFHSVLDLINDIQSGDSARLKKALDDLEKICNQDSTQNYFALALYGFWLVNDERVGYPKNEKSITFLKKTLEIKQDFVFAQHVLGSYLGELWLNTWVGGIWMRHDEAAAIKLLSVAAEKDYPPAQYNLAQTLYGEEAGSECDNVKLQNPDRLRELVTKSAKAGYPKAQFEFFRGIVPGVQEDLKIRVEYLELLAEKGHREAQYELGKCYEQGIGRVIDKEAAIKWYKACEENRFKDRFHLDIAASFRLARLFDEPNCKYTNRVLAYDYYLQTRTLGSMAVTRYQQYSQGCRTVYVSRGAPVRGGGTYVGEPLAPMLDICDAKIAELNPIIYPLVQKECSFLLDYNSSRADGVFIKEMISDIVDMTVGKKISTAP